MKLVEKPPRDALIKLYYDEHKTVFEIGNKYGCQYVTVLKWFKEYDIPRHGERGVGRSSFEKPSRDALIKLYYDKHKTLSEIGDIYDCSASVIAKWFDSYELPRYSRGDYGMNPLVFPLIRSHPVYEDIERDNHQSIRDAIECSGRDLRDELIKLYYDKHKTLSEISEIYGCSVTTVLKWFKDYNLPRRKGRGRRINPDPYAEKKKKKPVVKHISHSNKSTCTILREHAHDLEDDPERLSTDFLQKLIGRECK